ncbi:hypothetical protein BLA18109_00924 [Burkholderia lata]|uniref:Uncharacterized protein n=1 Tax=Burkholderia lata (strain ATCC 17760 / DSM 23089 / LMG 22485 / NCIMB 9086 / R18194 / 383) TaxID=482957 RepID=A0A6P2SZU3_BURL3|nr:hypothetical protein BLA18109_00924 [Burkholderia lata]
MAWIVFLSIYGAEIIGFIGVFPNAVAPDDNPLVVNKLSVYAT